MKDNWPALAEDVRLYFDREPARASDCHQTTDGDHGRIEVRRHVVSHDVGWLAGSRRFPGEPRFPGLAMIGMVEAEVERAGKTSLARRYYLCSAPLSAKAFAHAVRAHWGIENRLHWVMDVVFHDDLMRLRTGHGPANMATIRHAALNLISSALWFSLRNEPSSDSPGLDGLGDGLPSVDLAHGDLAGGEQSPEQHGHGLGAGQHGLGLDAPAEFLVQPLDGVGGAGRFPLRRIEAGEGEQPLPGFLEAVGDGRHLRRHLRRNALRRVSTSAAVSA